MPIYVEYILAFLLVTGGIFAFIGSYGLAKLNDFYMRLHGPTKATTLGLGAILAASSIYFTMTHDVVSLHEVLITGFLFITAPVSAHLLSKTALAEGFHFSSDQGNPLNHPLNVGTRQTHDTTGVDDLTEDAQEAYEKEMEAEEAAMMAEAHEVDDEFDALAEEVAGLDELGESDAAHSDAEEPAADEEEADAEPAADEEEDDAESAADEEGDDAESAADAEPTADEEGADAEPAADEEGDDAESAADEEEDVGEDSDVEDPDEDSEASDDDVEQETKED